MHVNSFDRCQVAQKGFVDINKEDLLKMGVSEKLSHQIFEQRLEFDELKQFELDFIEDFLGNNTYRDDSDRKILRLEEMAKYGFNREDNLFNAARTINIQMKAYSL